MCEPATMAYAAFAITAVQAIGQYEEQQQQAKNQRAYNEEQEKLIANGIAKDNAALSRQYEEINAVSKDDSQQRLREYLIESARLKTIGAESGLMGATQDRIEQEAQNNADTDLATIEANRQRQTEAAHTQGVAKASQSRYVKTPVRKPSALGAGLQIAGAGVSSYLAYDPSLRNLKSSTQTIEEIRAAQAANGAK